MTSEKPLPDNGQVHKKNTVPQQKKLIEKKVALASYKNALRDNLLRRKKSSQSS